MSRKAKSYIESMGVYLPKRQVTTKEIMEGCANHVRLPLERLTGIRSRHMAGKSEFSIDLAIKSVEDCLAKSDFGPDEVDVLMCANISRYDAAGSVTYEPSTAVTLKKRFGFSNALAFDISNACAGMWTAVYTADAMIRSGSAKRVLIVSGEYISYLTDTAQREVVDAMDPQIASLTLGDAGVTIAMGPSPSPDVGFHDLEIFTLSQYSRFCVAKPTNSPEGGAAMHTDSIKITAVAVPYFATLADKMLARNDWQMQQIEHVIPHQTSRLTMRSALNEIGGRYGFDLAARLVDNLGERGNTASTAHLLALYDSMVEKRIQTGDNILFMISGSGQTLGTALYTCDGLPDRTRGQNGSSAIMPKSVAADLNWGATLPVPMQIESIGVCDPTADGNSETLPMLLAASKACLDQSRYTKTEVQTLISVGVYRTEFLTEPAIAALLAGDLELTVGDAPNDDPVPLAFDLLNGSVGFLNACYVLAEMARVGTVEKGMIVASEVENNTEVLPDQLLGVKELATAVLLHPSDDGETGFHGFGFYDYTDHLDAKFTAANWDEQGRTFLLIKQSSDIQQAYVDCIEASVERFLEEQGYSKDEIKWFLPPQISSDFVAGLASRMGFATDQTVDVSSENLDLATSSTPAAMQAAIADERMQQGDLGLIVNVGSGIQVACALYQF